MSQKTEFPLNALPEHLQGVMWNVFNQTKTPAAMIFSALMVAIATSAQDTYRVQRKPGLSSNISIYFCSLASSGSRKSTLEKMVFKPLHDIQSRLAAEREIAKQGYRLAQQRWMLQNKVLEERCLKALRKGNTDPKIFDTLAAHAKEAPEAPSFAKLFYRDTTIEAWLSGLSQNSRSATLLDDEGGQTLHGPLLRSTGELCSLWDGKNIDVQRKQAGNFSVENPRVSISIQVQPDVFFGLEKNKAKTARASGLWARFLISEPSSMIGFRLDDDVSWPTDALETFHQRLEELYSRRDSITLTFTPDAQNLWSNHYNEIETSMAPGGYLAEYQDFGSKIPENTARLAALIHLSSENSDQISWGTLLSAIQVMSWFANETIHIFGGIGPQTQFMHQVMEFEKFMAREHAKGFSYLTAKQILQNGPGPLRRRLALNPVLNYLWMSGRCEWFFNKKTQYIRLVQPASNSNYANSTQQLTYQLS